MATTPTFDGLSAEYAALWASLEPRASKVADVKATAAKIIAKKARYRAVEAETSVPWYVIGLIHAMEGGSNFGCHLHNGDPLTGRTKQVPAGRPKAGTPPFAWKDSAVDALTLKGLDKIGDWPIERIAYELERYNGWGYRRYHSDVLSPYLWSGTNHYSRGKYVADGKWSASTVSGQSGAMAILKRIIERDADVRPDLASQTEVSAPADIEEKVGTPAEAFPRAEPPAPVAAAAQSSRTVFGLLTAFGATLVGWFRDSVEQIALFEPVRQIGAGLGFNLPTVVLAITVAGLALALFARLDDAAKGKTAK